MGINKMRKMEPALLLPVLIILIAITSEARFFLMKMKKTILENKVLGKENDIEILLKKGPYGPYVQLGQDDKDKKLKRAYSQKYCYK